MAKRPCLTHLSTPLGMRSLENSVAYCNRCGLCAPACPTYDLLRQEKFSPRGRNQLLRLILENKLCVRKLHKEMEDIVRSCRLCGQCTRSCPGQIPTSEHMLELRRMLGVSFLPKTLQMILRWRAQKPYRFQIAMYCSLLLHQAGLLRWGSILPGFTWLKHACEILPASGRKRFHPEDCPRPTLIYLPSLEAEFLQPRLATQVYQKACRKYRVRVWNNTPSGLFEYLYGDIRQARKQLRRLITLHAQTNSKIPLLTDSFDVYQFLKKSPQLFEGFSHWQMQAKHFAAQVRFISDLWPKTISTKTLFAGPVYQMPSVLFDAGHPLLTHTQEILHTLFKKNFVQCGYKDAAVAPAAYHFVSSRQAQQQALRAVAVLAEHQIQTVFVPSGLAVLELSAQLRRFYPTACVYHLAELDG